MVIPVDVPHDTYSLLGVILCLRHVIPQLSSTANTDQGLKGSFGQMQRDSHEGVSSDHIQKVQFLWDGILRRGYCLGIASFG